MCFSRDSWGMPVTLQSFLEVTCSLGGQWLGVLMASCFRLLCAGQPGGSGS